MSGQTLDTRWEKVVGKEGRGTKKQSEMKKTKNNKMKNNKDEEK